MRRWAISPDFACALHSVIAQRRPRVVLEMGSGVSTLLTGYALEAQGYGTLRSLEHDADHAKWSRAQVALHGLERHVEVIHAPLRPVEIGDRIWQWYDRAALEGLDAVDLVVVDGSPMAVQEMARYPALPLLVSRLAPGAVVVLDDMYRADERGL
jgi:predicted O-methyltransferase YrrM